MVVSTIKMTNKAKWYQSWFNTPYYHILYKQRNQIEAEGFIKNLVSHFDIKSHQNILDLACGKGRHAIFLNSLGYNVLGVDLSSENIKQASSFTNSKLNFLVHDMRYPLNFKFDVIFNLFTSFGYFENPSDDIRVINTIKQSLFKDGLGIIDFMNVEYVIDHLVPNEIVNSDGLSFEIGRHYDGQSIKKNIKIIDRTKTFNFEEKVRAYRFEDFEKMFKLNDLQILECFGNYNLEAFDKKTSKRLILAFTTS